MVGDVTSEGFGQPLPAEELFAKEQFGCRLSRRDDTVWLALGGELDVFTAPRLRAILEDADLASSDALVFDMRGLTFVDSSGLAVILAAHERASKAGGEPVRMVIDGAPAVEGLFETIGARDYLHLVDDPAEFAGLAEA
jgi:anti-sigma B factor antagonist